MSSAKTIVKNTGFLFSTQVADKILSFCLIVLITRYLGDVGFGKYSFAFAFVGIFVALSNMGINIYLFREISKDRSKAKKLLDNFLSLKLVILFLVYVLVALVSWSMPKTREIIAVIFLVMLHDVMASLNSILNVVYQSYERNEFSLYAAIVDKGIALLLGGYVLIGGYGLNALLAALVSGKFVSFAYYYITCYKRFVKISFGIDFKLWKTLIKESLPFGLTMVFGIAYSKIDKVMIGIIKSYEATGWYSAASKLVDALTFIPTITVLATFPAMSRFFHNKLQNQLRQLYEKSLYYLVLIALPIAIGIILLAQRIILFIYKKEFMESAIVLQILSSWLVFIFLNYIMGYLLNSTNKQHLFTASTGVCTFVNIALNFALIPPLGHIGASIAAVLSQFINFCMLYYFTSKNGYPISLIKIAYKPLIAGVLMAALIYLIGFLPIFYIMPIAAVFYFAVLFLIRGIGAEEIRLIMSFFSKKP